MTSQSTEEEICCPKFDPAAWDEKTIKWVDKKFIKEKVATFFYMPINFGNKMTKLGKIVSNAGAEMQDGLCLSQHTSKWNMDLYLAVDKDIPDAENTTLTGNFFSKVFEGPFKDTGKWNKEFESLMKSKGQTVKNAFTWYTTCPKCAKKYGKNYVALLSQVD